MRGGNIPFKYHRFNFEFIYWNFGEQVCHSLKRWIDLNYKIIRITSQLQFLKTCKLHGVIPSHLTHVSRVKLISGHYKANKKIHNLYNRFQKHLLRIEIFDLHRLLDSLHISNATISYELNNLLPLYIWNEIQRHHITSFANFHLRLSKIHKGKFDWAHNKKNIEHINSIAPIKFQWQKNGHSNQVRDSGSNVSINEVIIDPKEFTNTMNDPLENTNKKWFVNLSSTDIPPAVSNLLQLGNNFCLPSTTDKKHIIHEFIKDLEINSSTFNNSCKSKIRSSVVPRLEKFWLNNHNNNVETKIINLYKSTKSFCKNNPSVIFTRADKGNVTVALDKEEYIKKMELLLGDRDTYEVVKKDPINSIEKNLNSMVKKWFDKGYISKEAKFKLQSSDSYLPLSYGLSKIHKDNQPLRIIVSSINTALYPLAVFLHKSIAKNLPHNPRKAPNSFRLYEQLSGKKINDSDILISLDVTSLFTNVPRDLVIESINKRWQYIGQDTPIPKKEFIYAVEFVLMSTYFKFNNVIYKQTYGTPMGSPLSPVIAEIVLQDIEEKALSSINVQCSFYFRYVDDIVMAAPSDKIASIFEIFNSIHDRIQFTIEYEKNNSISFMDLSLIVEDGVISVDWFRKDTYSGRYLSYLSNHPIAHKIGTVYNLVDRALLLSHPKFHKKNLIMCIRTLMDNGYPLKLIFKLVNLRIKKLLSLKFTTNNEEKGDQDCTIAKKTFVLPYIHGVTQSVTCMLNRAVYKMGYRCVNKLNRFIKVHKDGKEHYDNSNVIYKIQCKDCDVSYVGQTKRRLKTRINEHINNKKQDSSKHSVLSVHSLENEHEFEWKNVKILDSEPNYRKRIISETLHIKEQLNGINLKKDTESLDDIYVYILNLMSNNNNNLTSLG